MAGQVFISYSHEDREYVEALAAWAAEEGLPLWYDYAVANGERFEKIIKQQIDACTAFVVVMTPASDESRWVSNEITYAERRGKPVLPLLLRGEVFMRLNHLKYDDVTTGVMPGAAFLDQLRRLVTPRPPVAAPHAVVAIGEPGRSALEVGPGRPSRFPDSADHELTESAVPGAQVRGASLRGLMHRYQGQPRQDRFSVIHDQDSAQLLITVCDGVGAFEHSHEAARFLAERAPRAYLRRGNWPEALGEVNQELADHAAQQRRPEDSSGELDMAATLVAAAIDLTPGRRRASIAWTDDCSAWLLKRQSWTNLSASSDDGHGLHTAMIHGLPHARPQFREVQVSVEASALFVMTDGVGNPMAGSHEVRHALCRWWAEPPDIFTFARQVGFARKSHLDDRTVVGVWLEPAATGASPGGR